MVQGNLKNKLILFLGLCCTKILLSLTSNIYITAGHIASTQPCKKYILHKKQLLFQLMYYPNHISSVLHLYASVCAAALLANMENRLFSKPFERFTPSQRYPGLMLNLFGGGSGPLYTGFSVKRKKRGAKICKKKKHGRVLITKFTCSKVQVR